jgi:hypothetical protein
MAIEVEILDYTSQVLRVSTTEDFADPVNVDIIKGKFEVEDHPTDADILIVRFYDYNNSSARQTIQIDYNAVVSRSLASRNQLKTYLKEFDARRQEPSTQHHRHFLY